MVGDSYFKGILVDRQETWTYTNEQMLLGALGYKNYVKNN